MLLKQQIKMISEGLCDPEVMMLKIQLFIQLQIEHLY